MPKKKILILDDSKMFLKDISRKLTEAGYNVIARDQALGTSRVIIEEKPDIIMLDINMPVLSGGDLLEVFRGSIPSLPPILIFSELDTSELEKLAQEKKVAGYLQKSNSGQLLNKIEELIR